MREKACSVNGKIWKLLKHKKHMRSPVYKKWTDTMTKDQNQLKGEVGGGDRWVDTCMPHPTPSIPTAWLMVTFCILLGSITSRFLGKWASAPPPEKGGPSGTGPKTAAEIEPSILFVCIYLRKKLWSRYLNPNLKERQCWVKVGVTRFFHSSLVLYVQPGL